MRFIWFLLVISLVVDFAVLFLPGMWLKSDSLAGEDGVGRYPRLWIRKGFLDWHIIVVEMERIGKFTIAPYHDDKFHAFEVPRAAVEYRGTNPLTPMLFAVGTRSEPWYTAEVKFPVFSDASLGKRIGSVQLRPEMFENMENSEEVITERFLDGAQITFRVIMSHENIDFRGAQRLEIPEFPVIGHRGSGASQNHPAFLENTIKSYQAALSAGADGIEIDVRLTKDEVVVLNHDDEVPDCTNESLLIPIKDMRAVEFRESGKCTIWGVERPTLKELFRQVENLHLIDIDVKYWFDVFDKQERTHFVARILEDLEAFRRGQNVFFCTFNVIIAALLSLTQRKYPVAMLVGCPPGEDGSLFESRIYSFQRIGRFVGLAGFVADSVSILEFSQLSRDTVKDGWRLLSWGERNMDKDGIQKQLEIGVTGFVTDDVWTTKGIVDGLVKH
jgi:glycerophosphoryl diester phosphodiesterase